MDWTSFRDARMQFYFFFMFLGLPDDIHHEKPSFFEFKKNALPTDQPTDGPTDGRTDTPSYRDARTYLKKNEKSLFVKHVRVARG